MFTMSAKWLVELRERARELVPKIPYQQIRDSPTIKYYTDWNAFERCADPNPAMMTRAGPVFDLVEPGVAVVNGYLSLGKVPSGVRVLDLEDLGDEYGGLVLKSIDINESKALARHVANLLGGAYVEIAESLDEPLRIIVNTNINSQVLIPTHYTIAVNDGVRASLGLYIVNNGGCPSTTAEVYLGKDSLLNLLVISMGDSTPEFTMLRVITNENSSVVVRSLLIGGSMNHHREDYLLQGARSRLNHLGLEVGVGSSRIDYQVNAMHLGEGSSSYSRVLGVARDRSFVIHRALGRIFERARWSDTNIEGKVFVLNEGAYAASVPVIMVDTGDVNGARHSAADASLDEDQVNYLRLRGFGKDEVIDLVLYEVAAQFLDSLPEDFKLDREVLRRLLMSRLGQS